MPHSAFRHRPIILGMLFFLMLASIGAVMAATLVVHPGNNQGWVFEEFPDPPVDGQFVAGPGAPVAGTGSFRVVIDESNEKLIMKRTGYHGVRLDALNELSYWTYKDATSTENSDWYINMYLDVDGTIQNGGYDVRLTFAPNAGSADTWTFQNAMTGTWIAYYPGGSPAFTNGTIAQFLVAHPDAVFSAWGNPADYQIRFSMGDTASNYVGYVGAIDAIRISMDGVGDNTWDFELNGPPSNNDDDDDDDDDDNPPAPPPQQTVNGIPTSFGSDEAATVTQGQIVVAGGSGNINQNGTTGSSYVKLIALNGEFYGDPSSIGNMELLNMGVLAAVDVFGLLPGGVSETNFATPVTVCFAGSGAVYFLSANDPTRTPVLLAGSGGVGQTCVSVPNAGLLVMVGTPNPAGIQPASTTETPLTDCAVTTTVQLRFRSGPSTSDPILAVLPTGTSVDASSRVGGWYGVTYNGRQGYVFAEFVETAGAC
jgi:hypothetical protein